MDYSQLQEAFNKYTNGELKEQPLNFGEVFSIWRYLVFVNGALVEYQTYLNHVGDKDLKAYLNEITSGPIRYLIQEFEGILKTNGVALPAAPPEKPLCAMESIPEGARVSDKEIISAIFRNISFALMILSQIIPLCTHEDLKQVFSELFKLMKNYEELVLKMRKDKGWLLQPPLHYNNPGLEIGPQ
ncbi:MAG: DUF3231 family protein [Clostridia bacterium]|nr:DUF3231 family protein [Clostridia bacterium]